MPLSLIIIINKEERKSNFRCQMGTSWMVVIQHRLRLEQSSSEQLLSNHGHHGELRWIFFCLSRLFACPFSILRAFKICWEMWWLLSAGNAEWVFQLTSCWKSIVSWWCSFHVYLKKETSGWKVFQTPGCKVGNVLLTLQKAMGEFMSRHRN